MNNKYFLLFIFAFAILIESALVALDLFINWWSWSEVGAIRRLFNITREDGLASFFAVIQTFLVTLVLWLIYFVVKQQNSRKSDASGWLLLACFFSYLTIDDGAKVHERIGTAINRNYSDLELPSYAWQVFIAPVFCVIGLWIIWFLWRQGNMIKRSLVFLALSCLATALAIDFVEGMQDGYQILLNITQWPEETVRHFSKSVEEFLEMLGMTLFLLAFIDYFRVLTSEFKITITNGDIDIATVD